MRNDNVNGPTNINARTYNAQLTNTLVQGLRALPGIQRILFNDPNIQGVSPARGHSDHLHVEFVSGVNCNP